MSCAAVHVCMYICMYVVQYMCTVKVFNLVCIPNSHVVDDIPHVFVMQKCVPFVA